ncbi:MAG: 4-alpha-glucanotransferase, partial [Elusimicrobiota bacterium]
HEGLRLKGYGNILTYLFSPPKTAYRILTRQKKIESLQDKLAESEVKITELEKKAKIFEELAGKDALTGIYNFRFFNEFLRKEVERAKKQTGIGGQTRRKEFETSLSLITFDIDFFKKVNDVYGHGVGDKVLKAISETVSKNIRETDVFARVGGEEFAIILPQTNEDGARKLAEKIRKAVEDLRVEGDRTKVSVTISLGVCEYKDNVTSDIFYKNADSALYKSKDAGRNKVTVYNIIPEPKTDQSQKPQVKLQDVQDQDALKSKELEKIQNALKSINLKEGGNTLSTIAPRRWDKEPPVNFDEMIEYYRQNGHESPLEKIELLINDDFDKYLEYKQLMEELLPYKKYLLNSEKNNNNIKVFLDKTDKTMFSVLAQLIYYVPSHGTFEKTKSQLQELKKRLKEWDIAIARNLVTPKKETSSSNVQLDTQQNQPLTLDKLLELLKDKNRLPKVIAFDFDGTLIPLGRYTRQMSISDEMKERLKELSKHTKIAIITGSSFETVNELLGDLSVSVSYIFTSNGATLYENRNGENFKKTYSEKFNEDEISNIKEIFNQVMEDSVLKGEIVIDRDDRIYVQLEAEDEGKAFEMARTVQSSPNLKKFGYQVFINKAKGTITISKKAKDFAINELIQRENTDDILYVGDEFSEFGNDVSVLNVSKILVGETPSNEDTEKFAGNLLDLYKPSPETSPTEKSVVVVKKPAPKVTPEKDIKDTNILNLATKQAQNATNPAKLIIETAKETAIPKSHKWLKEEHPELYGKTMFHVSPGFKPSPDFLSLFDDEKMRIRVANGHQTGGLEPLVTEELVELTDMGMNAIGVSLLYKYAPMQQDDGSIKLEKIDYEKAIEKEKLVYLGKVGVPIEGKDVIVRVWAASFNTKGSNKAVVLYLDYDDITTQIYPGDLELRAKQMLLLGRGTLSIVKEILEGKPEFREKIINLGLPFGKIEPAIIQMNEALTVFAHPKTINDKFIDDPKLNSITYGFTTHTPVEAGLQKLPTEWADRIKLNPELWRYSIIRNENQLDLTKIAMILANIRNAVSKEHGMVIEQKLYPEFKGLIKGIVNGISLLHWQIKEMGELVDEEYTEKNVNKMVGVHSQAKQKLANWIYEKTGTSLDTTKLFSVEARRKSDFKSVDTFIAAMRNPSLRNEFLNSDTIQIFLGKPHITDNWGLARVKELIALSEGRIIKVTEDVCTRTLSEGEIEFDDRLKSRVVFVPNFNVEEAPIVFQGADVLCMWSVLGTEASATGYMKGIVNAIITLATRTGGPLEHIRELENGVFIDDYLSDGQPLPKGLMNAMSVISNIYRQSMKEVGQDKLKWDVDWYKMMWNALQTTHEVDVKEQLKKYITELWSPAYNVKIASIGEPTKTETGSGVMTNKTNLAIALPIFSLRNDDYDPGIGKFLDLKNVYKNKLKPAGVNTLMLLPHFRPSKESPYAPVDVRSVNEDCIDLLEEAKRLGLPKEKIENIRRILHNETCDEKVDYGETREKEFDVAMQLYDEFLKKEDKEFTKFKEANVDWLANYTDYMSAWKILGRHPVSKEEIDGVCKVSPEKWAIYPSLYEYLQYVGYGQLEEVIKYVHSEGGKVMFDMPFFRSKNSVDVVYHKEYFDNGLKSPGAYWLKNGERRGGIWSDIVLYNWDELKKVEYRPIISPAKHWLKFGFDGLRLDALQLAYPLKHLGDMVSQSGNEQGDDFVSQLAAAIRSVNPQAVVVAEAFEGTDVHIKNTYGFYTISLVCGYNTQNISDVSKTPKVWLQISSHDVPRVQNDKELIQKYGIERSKESFIDFFNTIVTKSGAEFISFTLGDQYGDDRPIKESVDGETSWTYRMPAEVDLKNKRFDITELLGKMVFNSQVKTETGYFQQGYTVGNRLKLPKIDEDMIKKLQQIENFSLRYNDEKDKLDDMNAPGLHVLLKIHQYMESIKIVDERGKASLLYHGRGNHFFEKLKDILNRAGLTEEAIPDAWAYINQLSVKAITLNDIEDKANINRQLFGFVQGLLENVQYQQYLSNNNNIIPTEAGVHDVFKKLLVAADSFIMRDEKGNLEILTQHPFKSLPGLLLTTGKYEEAKEVFRNYAKYQRDGFIPNTITSEVGVSAPSYNSADSSLWFIEALYKYYEATEDIKFIKELLPVVSMIIARYKKVATDVDLQNEIYLDSDNLIVTPSQLTLMDATPQDKSVMLESGKPIGMQALFYNALGITIEFNKLVGNKTVANELSQLRGKIGSAINQRFFEEKGSYPSDVVDGGEYGNAIRSNAIFLLSLSKVGDLLTEVKKKIIVDTVEKELLSPFGIRVQQEGTILPHLISHYIFSKINQVSNKSYEEVIAEVKTKIGNLVHIVREKGTVPEMFDGRPPHMGGGHISDEKSVAAMLEILNLFKSEFKEVKKIDRKELEKISVEEIKKLLGAG